MLYVAVSKVSVPSSRSEVLLGVLINGRKKAVKTRRQEKMEETQSSESREERGQMLVRCDSMDRIKPNLSCDPDGPVKSDSVKTEERLSSNPSSSSASSPL
ncbi:hypothetical protein F2P79_026095 [Pimephales promelas]|nr:hypothetical protein F2P79_026095 [Pimephales promelas]KAG1924567.1 hypothetical protein F2P79_026095 [Pimephales promelas]